MPARASVKSPHFFLVSSPTRQGWKPVAGGRFRAGGETTTGHASQRCSHPGGMPELEEPGFVLGAPLHGIARTIFIVSTLTVQTRASRAITLSLGSAQAVDFVPPWLATGYSHRVI